MTIDVIDAYGTTVGTAEVEFKDNPGHPIAAEVAAIMEPQEVTLPTRNPAMSWRLAVRP